MKKSVIEIQKTLLSNNNRSTSITISFDEKFKTYSLSFPAAVFCWSCYLLVGVFHFILKNFYRSIALYLCCSFLSILMLCKVGIPRRNNKAICYKLLLWNAIIAICWLLTVFKLRLRFYEIIFSTFLSSAAECARRVNLIILTLIFYLK